MSPNVAVPSADPSAVRDFYTRVLGFAVRDSEADPTAIDAAPMNFFLTDDAEISGPVLELFVDDVEAAREELLANGCEVVRWHGRGRDCYIRDPFGVVFNLWEDR